jgi:cytochrome c nitrite reductase small subunit
MPRKQWLVITTALLMGTLIGIGAFTFVYARGASYLTNNPQACANCHVMIEHYAAWLKSSHHRAAVCNDCHAPHTLHGKYATKARNGFWHSFYFTTGNFPDPLRITPGNLRVTERACRHCHEAITAAIEHGEPGPGKGAQPIRCSSCHRHVGHQVR